MNHEATTIDSPPSQWADWSDSQLEAEAGRLLRLGWDANDPYLKRNYAQQAQALGDELARRRGVSFHRSKRKKCAPGPPLSGLDPALDAADRLAFAAETLLAAHVDEPEATEEALQSALIEFRRAQAGESR